MEPHRRAAAERLLGECGGHEAPTHLKRAPVSDKVCPQPRQLGIVLELCEDGTTDDRLDEGFEVVESETGVVDLSEEGLQRFPNDLFDRSPHLRELILFGNELVSLPKRMAVFAKTLVELHLYENKLVEIPDSIGALTQLKGLYLHKNCLVRLPASIGALTKLEELSLGDNALEELPPLGNLKRLQLLEVEDNKLTTLPASLCTLSTLRTLNLENNQLTALPASLGSLVALCELNVSANNIVALPESIGALTRVAKLTLFGTALKELPESIVELQPAELGLPSTFAHLLGRGVSCADGGGAVQSLTIRKWFAKLVHSQWCSVSLVRCVPS